MHRIGARRRGEGHVEYVIITSLIMVCALVAMFSITDGIKAVALEKRICVECPEMMTLEELDAHERGLEDDLANPELSDEERAAVENDLDRTREAREDLLRRLDEDAERRLDEIDDGDEDDGESSSETDSDDTSSDDGTSWEDETGVWDLISWFGGAKAIWDYLGWA